jgi:hypothetical protein
MAGHEAGRPDGDETDTPRTSIEEHEATYHAFLNLAKWATGVVILLLIGMAVFLV